MKKNIKVVIGSNWGDEGKGLMVDYFCRQTEDRILNVRYNGGAQAGHTVITEEGLRHVFSHFGAGSFNDNVDTYLTRDFIVNPIFFWREYKKLLKAGIKPKVYIHADCYITTPYDMMINQIIEEERGVNRHGSVGVGIFETVNRSKHIPLTIKFANNNKKSIVDMVADIKNRWAKERLNNLGVKNISSDMAGFLNDDGIFITWCDQLLDFLAMTDVCEIVDDTIMDKYKNIIFEGAQGLLLDQNNMDFWPNLTPSNTGMKNVIHALSNAKITDDANIDVCYVTRTYFTRHGAGLFPSECEKDDINPNMVDITNKPNLYQGTLRYGYFDKNLFIKSVSKDIEDCNPYNKKFNLKFGLAVTHFNETDYYIKMKDEMIGLRDFAASLKPQINKVEELYASDGMTWRSIEKIS